MAGALERPPPDWRRRRGRPANTWLIQTTEADLRPLNYGLHAASGTRVWRAEMARNLSAQQRSDESSNEKEVEDEEEMTSSRLEWSMQQYNVVTLRGTVHQSKNTVYE